MKTLLFDPCAGASGDMIIGCLLDLGANEIIVREAVESVGCRLEISKEKRCKILASRARVISDRHYQTLSEANSILNSSSLKGKALEHALLAIDILAGAESRVHGLPKENAKFHEVGALDALADISGSCAAIHTLKVDRVLSRPVFTGGGFISSDHGLLPVPGPAVLEILRAHKIPWKGGPADHELLTPTGAALLASLVEKFINDFPCMKTTHVGYGAGQHDLPFPNVLRGLIAEIVSGREPEGHNSSQRGDRVVQLETNVDDVTGEVLGYLMESLMRAGALDVSAIPGLMKKGRSANIIRVIARQDETETLARIMIRETGSLGVRVFPSIHRFVAEREAKGVSIQINDSSYEVSIKLSRLNREIINIKPEFDDCKRIAEQTGLPIRIVMKMAEDEGWREACL